MTTILADLPPQERPRERLLRLGPQALSDRELLALLLRHGRRGESALDLATALLAEHGSLDALATARPEELATRSGVGAAKAATLVAAFQLRNRTAVDDVPLVLRNSEDIAKAARKELSGLRRERVVVLVCDAANRLRRTVVVSGGAVDRSIVPVREILNAVLRHDGRAFAIAHNHPSGNPEPSEADHRATAKVRDAASVVGLRFLGHVVVGGNKSSAMTTISENQTPH
jgi:DNA repair protein RadC